jgi:hypothetical protein
VDGDDHRRSLTLASQQKSFLFLFRRKNMARIKENRENFFAGFSASNKASGGAASIGQQFSVNRFELGCIDTPTRKQGSF